MKDVNIKRVRKYTKYGKPVFINKNDEYLYGLEQIENELRILHADVRKSLKDCDNWLTLLRTMRKAFAEIDKEETCARK